jgi:hypothetical protein
MVPATLVRTGRLYSLTGSGRTLLSNFSHTLTAALQKEDRLSSRFPAKGVQNQILGSHQIECFGILRSEESV